MSTGRMEAFSDGVIAIVITIMVLELTIPEGGTWQSLASMVHPFFSYVLSFVYVGIYWNNHHHLLQAATKVNGQVLWANLGLLFCLSLIPVSTAWWGTYLSETAPAVLYGVILWACSASYALLQGAIIKAEGDSSLIKRRIGKHRKGRLSLLLYMLAVITAFWYPLGAAVLYVVTAAAWLVPDKRLEPAREELL